MKNRYLIFLLFAVSLLFTTASCEPIEDRQSLQNTVADSTGVSLVAIQTNGGNKIQLIMQTPGVTGYWDYNLDRAYSESVTFTYPIPGKATFTFTGTLGAKFFTKTIDVQIDQIDSPLDQDWYDLVSTNTMQGKTWVFAGKGGDEGQWWYMCPGNDPTKYTEVWWNAGGTCCPPADVAGKMHFDLDGAANYQYFASATGSATESSFKLDLKNMELVIFNGVNILGAEEPRGNPAAVYKIISLTEEELILYNPMNSGGTGWVWKFKPQL